MKNYKQILEAINRGIQLALDDFDDEEQVQNNIKTKQINHRDYTKEYLDLMKEVVDLGLPSKTLWCKYNLGVDINNITSPNQLIGDYYAWGEIKPNKLNKGLYNFNWYNYKFAKGAFNQLKKYIDGYTDLAGKKDLHYETLTPLTPGESIRYNDDLTQLELEDDAAYQNKKLHNFKFHIPTSEQFEELIEYTTFKHVYGCIENGHINYGSYPYNTAGLLLISKINDNQVFFPFGSYKDDANKNPFVGGHYWTSDLYIYYPSEAWYMCCGSNFIKIYTGQRHCGMNIRPVINL